MRAGIGLGLTIIGIILSGCAAIPQQPVQLRQDSLVSTAKIGVGMTPVPKVDTHLPGADCLLCMAAASIANSKLTDHTRTLPYEDLPNLKLKVADAMRARGANVRVFREDLNLQSLPDYRGSAPNAAKKDFSSYRKFGLDKLLVIDVTLLGMLRPYSAYIPNSDPKGVFRGAGYIVNLSDNTYEWYMPVEVQKSADGEWDEPPKFPGLTNAYFQALELGKDSFIRPFSSGMPVEGLQVQP